MRVSLKRCPTGAHSLADVIQCLRCEDRTGDAQLKGRLGCITGGWAVWNLRYTNDTTLIAGSTEEHRQRANELENVC